jgi:hypothetical protein
MDIDPGPLIDPIDSGPGLGYLPSPTPPPINIASSRTGRAHRLPKRYNDYLPSMPTPLAHIPDPSPQRSPSPISSTPHPDPDVSQPVHTEPNDMGLFRIYPTIPAHDPLDALSIDDVCDSKGLAVAESCTPKPTSPFGIPTIASSISNIFAPFLNMTVYRLMDWYYSGSNAKSLAELDRLVNEVILQDDFDPNDLKGFRASTETKRMDQAIGGNNSETFSGMDGWTESLVTIRLPACDLKKRKYKNEEQAPGLEIPGVWHRDIVEVIESAWKDDASESYHSMLFKEYVQLSPEKPPKRVFGEAFTADAFLVFDEEIRAIPREPGCDAIPTVVGMMLWSDLTHLTNFGSASLWPIYLSFGNQSKYARAKPTSFASHHVAYIPSVCLFVK